MLKRPLVLSVLMIAAFYASAQAKTIKEIVDAGIYCGKTASETDGFYLTANKRCTGNTSCNISAVDVAPLDKMKAHQCTGFFVNIKYVGGGQHNFEAKSLTKRLTVRCR